MGVAVGTKSALKVRIWVNWVAPKLLSLTKTMDCVPSANLGPKVRPSILSVPVG